MYGERGPRRGPPFGGGGYRGGRMHRIFGTEEDKVNCSFYFKIGACRHGERCSRLHMKPNFSQTVLLAHLYMPPPSSDAQPDPVLSMEAQMKGTSSGNSKTEAEEEHYENFYEDILEELAKFGDVQELVVCENLGDHMVSTRLLYVVASVHCPPTVQSPQERKKVIIRLWPLLCLKTTQKTRARSLTFFTTFCGFCVSLVCFRSVHRSQPLCSEHGIH